MTTATKRCPKCGEVKDRSAFSPGNSKCKPCKVAHAMARYWSDPVYREEKKAWHKERERQKRADPEWNANMLAKLREKRATNAEWREHTLKAVNDRRKKYVGRHLAIAA